MLKNTEFYTACYSAKLDNSEGNKEKIFFGEDLFLILRLVFEYVNIPF